MKKHFLLVALAFLLVPPVAGFCGELDSFLSNMNVQARVDLPGFHAKLSTTFGVPLPQVEAVVAQVQTPADAYMVFRVGEVAHQPQDVVLREYKAKKGKGWGVIAKDLGIKPGSPEFHALKKGMGDGGSGKGKDKDKGKGKGKGKGKKG